MADAENRTLCDLDTIKRDGCIFPPVAQLAVSRTLGDIACVVHERSDSSRLELRNINGAFIAATSTSPLITSVCFSSAPEGTSINVVAAGLANGVVRLVSLSSFSFDVGFYLRFINCSFFLGCGIRGIWACYVILQVIAVRR